MMVRTQVSLDSEVHRQARNRAAAQGISLAEYVRLLVAEDLDEEPRSSDPSAFFDLGSSEGSDVAERKDEMIGEAVEALRPRRG